MRTRTCCPSCTCVCATPTTHQAGPQHEAALQELREGLRRKQAEVDALKAARGDVLRAAASKAQVRRWLARVHACLVYSGARGWRAQAWPPPAAASPLLRARRTHAQRTHASARPSSALLTPLPARRARPQIPCSEVQARLDPLYALIDDLHAFREGIMQDLISMQARGVEGCPCGCGACRA